MNLSNSGYRTKVIKINSSKKRKLSSNKWLKRQLNDCYTIKSKLDGYRSRAAYKLLSIHDKFNIFKQGNKVIDLGAAPGGWSQVAAKLINADKKKNSLIAVDLLEIEPIENVICIKANFLDPETIKVINSMISSEDDCDKVNALNEKDRHKIDVVMSDMAANTTGHHTTDHLRIMLLCEQAFEFSLKVLKPGGHFIAKIFQGGAEGELLNKIKTNFEIVKHFKPVASRKESSELYLIALNRKVTN